MRRSDPETDSSYASILPTGNQRAIAIENEMQNIKLQFNNNNKNMELSYS